MADQSLVTNRADQSAPVRRWLGRLLMVGFSLVFTLLLLEIILRVGFEALPNSAKGAIQNVRIVPWNENTLIPPPPVVPNIDMGLGLPTNLENYRFQMGPEGYFRVDTLHLWDMWPGLRSNPPQWPVDIVALGDSFTFCFTEFEDCWVERLHRDSSWSVMNLGQPGIGARGKLRMLQNFAVPMEPSIVIWQWYGNDPNDDYGLAFLRGEVEAMDAGPVSQPPPNFGKLARYSTVYALVRQLLYDAQNPPESDGLLISANEQTIRVGTDYSTFAHNLDRPGNAYGWETGLDALIEAERLTHEDLNAWFVLLLLPTKEEVYADFVVDALGEDYLAMLGAGRQYLNGLCAENVWYCIDPTNQLREAVNAGQEPFYDLDLHLNPEGNLLLSQIIAGYLQENGLLPRQ